VLGPAARPGLHLPDACSGELLFLCVALFVAIGALSHEEERPFSASIVYLGLGLLASAGIRLFGLGWIDPFRDAAFVEHLTEIALIVALFASGLRVKEGFSSRRRRDVALLLAAVMPATIAAVALFGVAAMGLPFGAALLLGAMLAPTDPVLAGAVGLGPPGGRAWRATPAST
jgi:NhaP-type Na+/H+ or K+/H+ antiporter